MIQLITKADLPDYTRVSVNISDALVNPPIRDAHTFDVLPLLSLEEQQALAAYLASPDRSAYLLSYAAAEAQGFPAAELAVLQVSPLYARHLLYTTAVRPLLCYHAYRRFLLDAGVHITPNSLELTTDRPVSSAQRAEMRADAAAKCSHFGAVLAGALRVYRGPATLPPCGPRRARRPRTGGFQSSAV